MSTIKKDHLIIGAGPGGLAMAAHFTEAGLDFELIERSDEIAHSWYNHYDRLHLHTIKEFSSLPFKDFPKEYPTYISKSELIAYYEDYARHFGIQVRYNLTLEKVHRTKEQWRVVCSNGTKFLSKHVIFATGVNRVANYPHWNTIEEFQKEILHSRFYKNAYPFSGKRVLVVGFGNTGAEIALDLAENNVDVSLSVRSPVIVVPRDVFGRPVQKTAKLLEKLPYPFGDLIGSGVRKLVFGNLQKYGIPVSKDYPLDYLKKTGKTPVINIGTIGMIKKGRIKVLPDIDSLTDHTVLFADGNVMPFDTILLCTGYKPGLEEFLQVPRTVINESGYPISKIGSGAGEGLYFIGYNVFSLGGILGTIPEDAQAIMEHILK